MKWLLTLTVSVMLLAGCGTFGLSEDKPTPDMPAFVEGQATALVKLAMIERKMAVFNGDMIKQAEYPGTFTTELTGCALLPTVVDVLSPDILEEFYDGNGVWTVQLDPQPTSTKSDLFLVESMSFEWKVYESTGTVISNGITTMVDGSVVHRTYC